MIKRYCNYCKQWLEFKNYQSFGSHKGTCVHNPNKERTKQKLREAIERRHPKYFYTFKCKKCNKEYVIEMTRYAYKNKREPYRKHCSRSCANSHIQTPEMNESRKIKGTKVRVCPICETNHLNCQFKGKCCSDSCLAIYNNNIKIERKERQNKKRIERRKIIDRKQKYYEDTRFKFNVYLYPKEFNLNLIEKYGWYKAKNRGNNPNGVTRDHLISIKYGFKNNIPPELLAHPANCKLMLQLNNVSKNKNCSISLYELLQNIERWNTKYGGPTIFL